MRIKIGQLNANGSSTVMDQVRRYAEEEELDVLCLQEPYSRQGKITAMPKSAQVITHGKHPQSAIIVFNKNIKTTKITQISDEWTICVEIKLAGISYYIVSSYFQHRFEIDPFINKMKEICMLLGEEKLIITADSNAKSIMWQSKENDKRGEDLLNVIMEYSLTIANQPGNPPTFRNTMGHESNIDLTLMSTKLSTYTFEWKVEDGLTTSDHNIIRLILSSAEDNNSLAEDRNERNLRYNVNKLKWDKIEIHLKLPDVTPGCDVNSTAEKLTTNIRNAIEHTITSRPTKISAKFINKNDTEFWNGRLNQLRRICRAQRKNYQRTRDPIYRGIRLEAYRTAKKIFEEALKETKIEHWEKFVNNHLTLNPWGAPYKLMMDKIKSPTVLSTLKKENGTYTKNWKESVEYLLKQLLPDDSNEDEVEYHRRLRHDMELKHTTSTKSEPFTEEEVKEQILSLKHNKSPGTDEIKSEVIQKLQHKLIKPITKLYNECLTQRKFPNSWKESSLVILRKGEDKEPTNPKSYRPICLINVLGKLFEKLIIKRLNTHRMTQSQFDDQYGFRKGKSTEDAINRLYELINIGNEKYKICIFVDISGAFDNLWYPALFKNLRDINCPENLYDLIVDYCHQRTVRYKYPGENITKTTTKGCPQGSVCGPMFWDLAVEPCLYKLNAMQETDGVIAYADDIAIVISGNSRTELENKAKITLDNLQTWCKQNKLQLSKEKTVYMLLKGNLQRNPTIRTGDFSIKRVKTTKYLGLLLDEKLNFTEHIKYICNKSLKIMNAIISIGQRKFHLPLSTIQRYHDSILAAIISYGSSVWGHRMNLINEAKLVNRVQRSILIRLTGAYSTVAQNGLLVTLGIQPMHLTIIKRAANYWLRKQNYIKATEIIKELVTNRQEIAIEIRRRWQNEWDTATTGRRVYEIFPDITERLQLHYIKPERGMIHFITGHGPFNETLNRLGIKESAECACRNGIGSPEHVVFWCSSTNVNPGIRQHLIGKNTREILRDMNQYNMCNILTRETFKYIRDKYIEELKRNR